MRVITDLDNLPQLPRTIITIGSFDGIHSGHQKLLAKLKQLSSEYECQNLLMTFDPHPRTVVYPDDDSLRLLSTLQEKKDLLEKNGLDNLVIIPFTLEYSKVSPLDYIADLVQKFNPAHIVIGYDHKFGLDRVGDIHLLKKKAKDYDYQVHEISKQEIEDITISSTQIRNALLAGDIHTANALLARPYELTGTVVKGKKLGTEIGYPTANIELKERLKLIPKNGIYTCRVIVSKKEYNGMMYIGTIPTLSDEQKQVIEVNIFDFEEDIYDSEITIQFLSFLRDDEKFDGVPALKAQLAIDKKNSLAYFQDHATLEAAEVTVAVLTYNSCDLLETYLPSVSYSSEKHFSTLVIDNHSSDESVEYLAEWFPETEVVQLKKNHGFAEGYNIGIKRISTEYIAFLNSDVEVAANWLDPLLAYMKANKDCGAVMPKILSHEHKNMFEYAGASGGYLDRLAYPFCRGRVFDNIEEDTGQYDNIDKVAWVGGAAFVMRKDLFEQLGGFDGDYFAHQEEIDLCWRIRLAGYHLAVIPDSKVYHLGGGTLNYGNSRKVYLNFRNSLYTIWKNENGFALLWVIPLRLVLDGVAGLKFLVGGEPKATWAVLKSHIVFYLNLGRLITKRRKTRSLVAKAKIGPANKDGMIRKSIVWGHYLAAKKTFKDFISTSS